MGVRIIFGAPSLLKLRQLACESTDLFRRPILATRFRFPMDEPDVCDVDVPETSLFQAQAEIYVVESDCEVLVETPNFNEDTLSDHHNGRRDRRDLPCHGVPRPEALIRWINALLNMSRCASNPDGDTSMLDPPARIEKLRADGSDILVQDIRNQPSKPGGIQGLDIIVEQAQHVAPRNARGLIVEAREIER